jgi:carbamoyltransferase
LSEFEELFESFADIESCEKEYSPIIDFNIFNEMKYKVYNYVTKILNDSDDQWETSKNIAASLQEYTEQYVIELIKEIIDVSRYKICDVYLSGGLFANVKLNQHIHEKIENIENIFISPCMGDEGTCIGAVMSSVYPNKSVYRMSNRVMRIGTNKYIKEEYIPKDILYEKFYNIDAVSNDIAKELSQNKIICLFDGKMEFGPRALIGRSILYNCKDVNSNKWLNEQLGRTEFMPFAPFCKEENADKLFFNIKGKEMALKNMTITVDCKEYFIANCPAACHIDNTARPQVINKQELQIAWKILDEYEKLTGELALINTSFNLHNYPIIESVQNAVESWVTSNTNCLYINSEKGWYKLYK